MNKLYERTTKYNSSCISRCQVKVGHHFRRSPEFLAPEKGAPETANNAVTGGAMVPLLSLGIPGDPATAIILGGLLIHGLVPGPMLFIENAPQVYLYLAILLAYVVVFLTSGKFYQTYR